MVRQSNIDDDIDTWDQLLEVSEEPSNPNHKKWFAWYPVLCYDETGLEELGWFWLTYVWYDVWKGKNYYFHY